MQKAQEISGADLYKKNSLFFFALYNTCHFTERMYYIFSHSLILLLLEFIETKNLKTYQYAYRNSGLDNIYKTIYQLWDVWQCSRSCCLKSCIEHIDCRSFAFNSNSGLCQIFNRDFRGQPLTGTVLHGILHYDTTSGRYKL